MSKHLQVAAAIALSLTLGACATKGEPEFGSSARHMIAGQKADPGAPREGFAGVDGQKATKAIEGYRADKKPAGKTTQAVPTLTLPTSQ